MRCRPGDIAVVIDATHKSNLGRIVRVLEMHDGTGDLVYGPDHGPAWLVECSVSMTWKRGGKRVRRKTGPVPDDQLQPMRGESLRHPPRFIVISPSIESPEVRIALTSPLTVSRNRPC
jgi:hypothetical protein